MFGFGDQIPDEWNVLDEKTDLKALLADSEHHMQFIFKHSTRCGISSMAKSSLKQLHGNFYEQAVVQYVDVIRDRRLSNQIAAELSVMHHSPQLIAIHEGKVIWHGSHSEVRKEKIEALLESQNPAT